MQLSKEQQYLFFGLILFVLSGMFAWGYEKKFQTRKTYRFRATQSVEAALHSSNKTPSVFPTSPSTNAISINRGSIEDFDTLPGIGPAMAKRIITYRNTHGSFMAVDDLRKVKGVGEKLLVKIRGRLALW